MARQRVHQRTLMVGLFKRLLFFALAIWVVYLHDGASVSMRLTLESSVKRLVWGLQTPTGLDLDG